MPGVWAYGKASRLGGDAGVNHNYHIFLDSLQGGHLFTIIMIAEERMTFVCVRFGSNSSLDGVHVIIIIFFVLFFFLFSFDSAFLCPTY